MDIIDRSFKLNDRVLRHMIKRVKKHPENISEKFEQSGDIGAQA